MILRTYILYFKNGEMRTLMKKDKVYNRINMSTIISRWYRKNPYAKRIDRNWICQDYRIDQQRPIRDVYSEAYIEIVSMTEMEEKCLDNFINMLEKDIVYPFVCPYCEGINEKDNNFCIYCGNKLEV